MRASYIVKALESLAPLQLAAEWDNVGLLVGDAQAAVKKLLLCIDLTPQVVAEAASEKAGMVMAYHPPIFKAIDRVTASNTPAVYSAARKGLAVYSPHTALDAAPGGTNDVLADLLGLVDRRPLEPIERRERCKIVVFVQPENLGRVSEAAFHAGAGRIGDYHDCSFFTHGIGTFCGDEHTRPTIGLTGRHEATEELRLEFVAPKTKAAEVVAAVRAVHGYEEPPIDVYPLADLPAGCGLGRIGRLARPVSVNALVARIKKAAGLRHVQTVQASAEAPSGGTGGKVRCASCCAGSCGSLFRAAVKAGATFYLTGEMRHHDALAAAQMGLTCVCLDHWHSERLVLTALRRRLKKSLPGLQVVVSKQDRDPLRTT